MKVKGIQIVTARCKRCGRQLATLSRSIYGTEEIRRKFAGICERCITGDERIEMENAMLDAVAEKMGK